MYEVKITLIHPGDKSDDDERTDVFAEVKPVGRDEFQAAGVNGYKAQNQFTIWASEYDDQPELEVGGNRLTIYRTYGARPDGKIELYAAERVGNHGR